MRRWITRGFRSRSPGKRSASASSIERRRQQGNGAEDPRRAVVGFSAARCAFIVVAALIALGVVFLLTAPPVSAHKPVFESAENSGYADAIEIPDPEVSWAVYGYLSSDVDTDYYYFDVKAPIDLYTGILVPEKKVYADFRPSYVIVGPGLPGSHALPFPIPDGMGAVTGGWSQGAGDTFYEPFTGISYYRGDRKHTMLTLPGRYYLVVYDPGHRRGDYVLSVGEKEAFGLRDLPGVIAAVMKIRGGWVDHSGAV